MTLDETRAECDHALRRLEKLFKPECRLTLLMRTPGNDECELLFTKDDLSEVAKVIERMREREAK